MEQQIASGFAETAAGLGFSVLCVETQIRVSNRKWL
jgi:hypothetical protein